LRPQYGAVPRREAQVGRQRPVGSWPRVRTRRPREGCGPGPTAPRKGLHRAPPLHDSCWWTWRRDISAACSMTGRAAAVRPSASRHPALVVHGWSDVVRPGRPRPWSHVERQKIVNPSLEHTRGRQEPSNSCRGERVPASVCSWPTARSGLGVARSEL